MITPPTLVQNSQLMIFFFLSFQDEKAKNGGEKLKLKFFRGKLQGWLQVAFDDCIDSCDILLLNFKIVMALTVAKMKTACGCEMFWFAISQALALWFPIVPGTNGEPHSLAGMRLPHKAFFNSETTFPQDISKKAAFVNVFQDTSTFDQLSKIENYQHRYSSMDSDRQPGNSDKKMKCSICQYSTDFSTNLRRHMRIHTGQLFSCEKCSSVTNTKYYLQKHIRLYHSEQAAELLGNLSVRYPGGSSPRKAEEMQIMPNDASKSNQRHMP